MKHSKQQLWQRFQKYYTEFPSLGLAVDLSRVDFPDDFFTRSQAALEKAFSAMANLEKGAIANPDEKRMVGHYWLRNPALAPTPEIRQAIENAIAQVKSFAADVHSGKIHGSKGPFSQVLLIGIGGSALGPQFVSTALGNPATDKCRMHFFDNTDPDGMDRVLAAIGPDLGRTLAIVISKSGGTKETRNGMLEAEHAYRSAGLDFAKHAVAITSAGSELDKHAVNSGWLARFPMWDWVGGRTSELSPVGLLPAALQGINIDQLLAGGAACDEATRRADVKTNPAAQLALAWFQIGNAKGDKNMIFIPYKDRLELFSKYLQQLIMESLGKEFDLDGKLVHQGISVFGNKGSTDQHAYVQQLRDGRDDFFATFIEVLKDRSGSSIEVEPGATSGDFLQGFFLGTREALYEKGRQSITLTVSEVSPFIVGLVIALMERTVGLYATLININPYHQPGVEGGKKAAASVLDLQKKAVEVIRSTPKASLTAQEIADQIGEAESVETIFKVLEHLAANRDRKITKVSGATPFDAKFRLDPSRS